MQPNRTSTQSLERATMNSKVPQVKSMPVELDIAQLKHVVGGSPKGTWTPTDVIVQSPKGTW